MIKDRKTSYPIGLFDLVKGIAVIIVLLHHTVSLPEVNKVIFMLVEIPCGWLMGVFFVASGFGIREIETKAALKKYTKLYLKPYFIVGTVISVIFPIVRFVIQPDMGFYWKSSISCAVTYLLGIVYEPKEIVWVTTMSILVCWFILALFWGNLIINSTLKIKNRMVRIALIVFLAFWGSFLEEREFDYFGFSRGCVAVLPMYFGYLIKEKELLIKRQSWLITLPLSIIGILFMLLSANSLIFSSMSRIVFECVMGYFAAVISYKSINYENKFCELFRLIGRYSYWFVCVHTVEMTCIWWWNVPEIFRSRPNFYFVFVLVIRSLIIVAGCWLLNIINIKIRRCKRKLKKMRGAGK